MQKENTIIGWGLAGAIIGWQLYFKGQSFSVWDNNKAESTRTAAGLINPIVFKRQNKSWLADDLLPYADNFYSKIEKELDCSLLHRGNIFRIFSSVEEENNWSVKQGDGRFSHYLKTPEASELPNLDLIEGSNGLGKVETIGFLDTNAFIDLSRIFFLEKRIEFNNMDFDYEKVVKYTSTQFFFCEGIGLFQNPLFKYLPLNGTHGETLIIESEEYQFKDVLNKNMYILPLGNNQYKIGATYNWDLKVPVTTEKAKEELIQRLEAFTNFNYKVVHQQAGVRPTVVDRKPLLGIHPIIKNAIVFNGLGTKGVMLAPYLSNQLLDHVEKGWDLNNQADISRFQHFFDKKS